MFNSSLILDYPDNEAVVLSRSRYRDSCIALLRTLRTKLSN
jgi:hypothetical protein